jgi:hypothetical protein
MTDIWGTVWVSEWLIESSIKKLLSVEAFWDWGCNGEAGSGLEMGGAGVGGLWIESSI